MNQFTVIKSRKSEFENPITVSKGEEVVCLEDSNQSGEWAGWVLCKTKNNEGWIPHQIIKRANTSGMILEDYCAVEFDLEAGEVLVMEKELNGWIWGYKLSEPDIKAWAPLNCLEPGIKINRIQELAKKITQYSCEIKKEQKVVIQVTGDPSKPLVIALIREINHIGAYVDIINKEPAITAEIMKGITVDRAKQMAEKDLALVDAADVCIMIKSIEDESVMTKVPKEKKEIYARYYTKLVDAAILETTRWISLRYPNKMMALKAGMSFSEYENYFFKVCTIDYKLLSEAMGYLVELMNKTSEVKITGPDTDISFSIKNIPVHKCDGLINLPDGEVYTAPVRDSVNGYVKYNAPSIYQGTEFDGVAFRFVDGKIVDAKSSNPQNIEALNEILNMDDGARYIGEFALGVNPFITTPTKDILFDEKIAGSFHLTPGFSYKDAFNGNESAVHWDLVCIQTEIYGGGKIYFDDVLIREDGKFVIDELDVLNPK